MNFIFLLIFLLILIIIIFKKYKNKILFVFNNNNNNNKFFFLILFLSLVSFYSFFNSNKTKFYSKNENNNLDELNLKKVQLDLKNALINLILNTYFRIDETEKECYRICQLNNGNLKNLENLINELKLKHNLKYYTKQELLILSNSTLIEIATKTDRDFYSEFSKKTLNFIKNLQFEILSKKEE
jgi:hypothetical protein